MTLDEAIKHAEEVAENQETLCKISVSEHARSVNKKCANEHWQLAEWLKDYKKLKEQQPCEDCISRAETQTEIMAYSKLIPDGSGTVYIKVSDVVDILRKLPSVKPATVWHKVEDGLPKEHICEDGYVEPSESVLVMLNNGEQEVARFWGNRRNKNDYHDWLDLSYPTTLKVIAWTELPEWEE